MAQLLMIDDDPGTLQGLGGILRLAGHDVATASSGLEGIDLLEQQQMDLVLSDLRLPDMSGLEILRYLRLHDRHTTVPFVMVTGFGSTKDVVTAMRLGAADFLEKPVWEDGLLRTVETALARPPCRCKTAPCDDNAPTVQQAHAAARWARVVVPVLDASEDPRTIKAWSRLLYVSPGALRNWCRTAGITPRRSLVFARLLRAVFLSDGGRHKPENLLDVVDRRTLVSLLTFAGLSLERAFPDRLDVFLREQVLVRDPDALLEITRALTAHGQSPRTRLVSGDAERERARLERTSSDEIDNRGLPMRR
jgi:CheY-like chemotaxis protein